METVLIKRSVEKDGVPPEKGRYFVEFGEGFKEDAYWSGDYWPDPTCSPTHWYEELPLSKLIEDSMPSEEEKKEKRKKKKEKN